MKTLVTLILTIFIAAPVLAFGDECENLNFGFMIDLNSLFQNKCRLVTGKEIEYCKCLNENKNILTDSFRSDDKFKEVMRAQKKKAKEKLLNTYALMNYGSRLQEQAYGIKQKVGNESACTPDRFAKEFFESACREDSSDPACKKNINAYGGETIRAAGARTPSVEEIKQRFEEESKKLTSDEGYRSSKINKAAVEFASCDLDNVQKLTEDQVKQLEKIQKFYSNHEGLVDEIKYEVIKGILSSKKFCSNEEYDNIIHEYNFKSSFFTKDGEKRKPAASSQVEWVKESLKNANDEIASKMKQNFSEGNPDACVRYDHYKVISSIPHDDLLKAWSQSPDAILKDLEPKGLKSSSHTTNFLKNNPLLAKLVVTPDSRTQLASKLHELAKRSTGKNRAEKLKNFISFMKNDVAENIAKSKISDLYQCELLARNTAAVFVSPTFPEPPEFKGDGGFESLSSDFLACHAFKENKKSEHNIEETLAANHLYTILGQDNVDVKNLGPDNDPGYKDFIDKECKGFGDFRKNHISKYCKISLLGKKACEEKFLQVKKSRSKRLLRKYYEDNNSEIAELAGILNQELNEPDIDELDGFMDEENQDQNASNVYAKSVKPYITGSIFDPPYSSDTGDTDPMFETIAKAQTEYDATYGTGVISGPDSYLASSETGAPSRTPASQHETASISNYPSAVAPVINPGQILPGFMSQATTPVSQQSPAYDNPPQFKNVNDVENVVKNISKYDPERQDEVLQDAQDFLDLHKGNQEKIADLKKQLDELEDGSEIKNDSPVSRKVASSPFKNNISNSGNFNSSNAVLAPAPVTSSLNKSGGTSLRSSTDKAAVSYQKALNQMNERLPVEQMQFSSPLGANDFPGSVVKVDAALEISREKYEEIAKSRSGDELKDYLALHIHALPTNGVISLTCTKGCPSHSNEILVKVERTHSNGIILRGIKAEAPVVSRIHLRSSLLNELKR